MRNLLIVTTALALMGSAEAEWKTQKQGNKFDGSWENTMTRDLNGNGVMGFERSDGNAIVLKKMINGDTYICSDRNDQIQVKIIIDDGPIKTYYATVRDNDIILFNRNNSKTLFDYYTNGDRVDIRTIDNCGEKVDMSFDISGTPFE